MTLRVNESNKRNLITTTNNLFRYHTKSTQQNMYQLGNN